MTIELALTPELSILIGFILLIIFALLLSYYVVDRVKYKLDEGIGVDEIGEDSISRQKPWTRDELLVLCYTLKYGYEDKSKRSNIIKSIAEEFGRSTSSISKKINILKNIEKTNKNLYKKEREVFNFLNPLNSKKSLNEFNDSMMNILAKKSTK